MLQLELLALRHQLATMKRISPRPSPRPSDRLFWVLLSRLLPNWRYVLVIVKPETVIGWHRKSFRFFGPGSHDDREAGARQYPARSVILYQRSLVMTHGDGFPHALRLGFSARSAWRGDAGQREPCGTLSESPSLEAWGEATSGRVGEPPGASGSLDDAPHRPRLPSCQADRPRDLYGSLSVQLGIRLRKCRIKSIPHLGGLHHSYHTSGSDMR